MVRETYQPFLDAKKTEQKYFAKLQKDREKALLFYITIQLDILDFTHYDKRSPSFFTNILLYNSKNQYNEIKVDRSNFSDHMFFHLSNKSKNAAKAFGKSIILFHCKKKEKQKQMELIV